MKADLKRHDQCTAETRSDSDGQQPAELLSAGVAEPAGTGGGYRGYFNGFPLLFHPLPPRHLKSNLLLSSTRGRSPVLVLIRAGLEQPGRLEPAPSIRPVWQTCFHVTGSSPPLPSPLPLLFSNPHSHLKPLVRPRHHLHTHTNTHSLILTSTGLARETQGGMRSGTAESTLTCTDLPNTAAISRPSSQRHEHSFLPVTAETCRLKLCMRHVFPII